MKFGTLRTLGMFKALALLLVLSVMLFLVSCASVDKTSTSAIHVVTARSILDDQRREEAELRSERNGPEIAPADYRRLMATMASKRENAQRELAQFAKFQMDQKLALAEASSPKMVVTNGGDIPSNYRQVDLNGFRTHREMTATRQNSNAGAYSGVAPGREHAARFYRRQMQEDSATQAETSLNESMAQQPDPDAPYAIPVPGRPGYVTMPPKMGGYIDVRGYAPGTQVMDPWTKTVIRVP